LSGANPSLKSLVFSGSNYMLGGGTLTLASDDSSVPAIDVADSTTQQISSVIAGTQGLLKDGPGTLVLSGSNTYSGGTYVAAGTLMVNDPDSLPEGSSLTVGADAFSVFGPSAAAPDALAAASPVPEPGTLALIVAAICGAAAYQRVRRWRRISEGAS
jgi:fibronectin-binding autotransporter adhesin